MTGSRQPIRLLEQDVIDRIAAGEVIERPASVVKELVENALDAGARHVEIEVRGAGKVRIRVTDDGVGIPPEELPLAVARHATSKLQRAEEILTIRTLGFRGEALASIAAVSRLSVTSRPPGAPGAARLRVAGGQPAVVEPAGGPPGTTVVVEELFFNTPARLKFLKSDGAERRAVADWVTRLALARPEVRFTLWLEGRRALDTPGTGNLLEAAGAVYGASTARALLPVERVGEAAVAVRGYVGRAELSGATRGREILFVNGRWVESRLLAVAVERAYETLLPPRHFPFAILHVSLDPSLVDVNVHPAKTEVRFRDERLVFREVLRAVGEALRQAGAAAAGGLRLGEGEGTAEPGIPPGGAVAAEGTVGVAEATPAYRGRVAAGGLGRAFPGGSQAALEPAGPGGGPPGAPGSPAPPPAVPDLARLRVLGQLFLRYVVAEGPEGLWLIDQHVAHERVLYERLAVRVGEEGIPVQPLLVPQVVELAPGEVERLAEGLHLLARAGLEVTPFGARAAVVRGVPAPLAGFERQIPWESVLHEFLAEEGPGTRGGPWSAAPDLPGIDSRLHRVLATLACKAAVKAGDPLSQEAMSELLRELAAIRNPLTCPHGRVIAARTPIEAIDRQFGR